MNRTKLKRWLVLYGPFLLLALLGLRSQRFYVSRGSGTGAAGALSEIPEASSSHLVTEMIRLHESARRDIVVADTSNIILAKFLSIYINPSSAVFPANDFFDNLITEYGHLSFVNALISWKYPYLNENARLLIAARQQRFKDVRLDLHDGRGSLNSFRIENTPGGPCFCSDKTLLESGPAHTVLNRRGDSMRGGFSSIRLTNAESEKNRLIFVASKLGQPYYTGDRARTSLFQLEPDYFFKGQTMAGLGRHLLFNVVNPQGPLRIVMDYTSSLKSDGENRIPVGEAIGSVRVSLHGLGRGSARLFSDPIEPQFVENRPYLAIDMGVEGTQFADTRTGLMAMYGKDISVDYRKIVGFTRGISVISDSQYRALSTPTQIQRFPADLGDPNLEFSGIYEDGWLSEAVRLTLRQPDDNSILVIQGSIPKVDPALSGLPYRVLVDGREVHHGLAQPGELNLRIPVLGRPGVRVVGLEFDGTQQFAAPDRRRIAMHAARIGFEADNSDIVSRPLSIGQGWYSFEHFRGENFRWAPAEVSLKLENGASRQGVLALEVESGPGLGSRSFDLDVAAGDARQTAHASGGRETLKIPLAMPSPGNEVFLRVKGGGKATPGDGRTLNFRVFRARWIGKGE